jgi:Ca2+-binding EF-hand superfamily protein
LLSLAFLAAIPIIASAQSTEHAAQMEEKMKERFATTDVDHDGKLTKDEATKMPMVSKHFAAIDKDAKGYVTQDDIRAYAMQQAAARGKIAQ